MTTLKLSEAIRLGAMLSPQAFNGEMSGAARCAVAAAADAVGIEAFDGIYGACPNYAMLMERFPILSVTVPVAVSGCHSCERHSIEGTLMNMIWHLNDTHHWTREQVADWVETIESQQAIPQSNQEPEQVKA